MTTFSYTTGNPTNLTGGATASMNDIQGPFTDLRTFVNGSIDYANMGSVVDSYYKTILDSHGSILAGQAAGTYIIQEGNPFVLSPATNVNTMKMRYLDSAAFPSGSRSAKLRISASMFVNTIAPTITFTFGLYPLSTSAGAGGFVTTTLGAVVVGSTAALATPSASSRNHVESSDFAFPATDHYALGVVTTGTMPANSAVTIAVALDFRAT